jgi:hypothetical protein
MNNDLIFGREYTVEVADTAGSTENPLFAVCIRSDDGKLLVPLKIYRVTPRGENVLVIDEEGEASVYPSSFFTPLKLDPMLEKVLSNAVS